MTNAAPFDGLAADYDDTFTKGEIGRLLRAATWRHMDRAFSAGDRILELNCGTGEDTLRLARRGCDVLATDVSSEMLAATRAKCGQSSAVGKIATQVLAIEELDCLRDHAMAPFDGVLSNFGGLNCVPDLTNVSEHMAQIVRPGGTALFTVMGPWVPWEWAWYLARLNPAKAFRRLRKGGTNWRGMTITYPSIGELTRAFAPHFTVQGTAAIGAFIPPSYAENWATGRKRLLARLDRFERRFETSWPLPWLADHYLVRMERNEAP